MISRKRYIILGAFLCMVMFIIYTLCFFTPMASDDWNYVFIYGTQTRIATLADVFKSQYIHYFECNGRTICHILVQIVDSFLGKGVFNVLNTLMFVLFLYAIAINITKERSHHYKVVTASLFFLFLLMPGFNYGVLWMSGSFNYLWVATALLFFHDILLNHTYSHRAYILLFFFGLICGWSNEAFVIGLGGAYFLYFIVNRKELTTQRVVMLAGFFIGALFLVISPGSMSKAQGSWNSNVFFILFNSVLSLDNLRLLPLLFIVVLTLVVMRRLDIKLWLRRESILVMATLLSLVFVIFTAYSSDHSRWGIELFAMMLILRLISWDKLGNVVFHVANAAVLVIALFAIQASYRCYLENEDEFAQMSRHEFPVKTKIPYYHPALDRFIVSYEYTGWGNRYKQYGPDELLSHYFDDENLFLLPQDFVDAITENPVRFNTFQTDDSWPFYAKIANEQEKSMDYATIELYPVDYESYGWPLKYLVPKIKKYVDWEVPAIVQKYNYRNACYILVGKHEILGDRFKTITLKTTLD